MTLYDGSAEVLHCRNPYPPEDPTINVKYTVADWLSRIKALLSWHLVQIVYVQGLWVVRFLTTGRCADFSGRRMVLLSLNPALLKDTQTYGVGSVHAQTINPRMAVDSCLAVSSVSDNPVYHSVGFPTTGRARYHVFQGSAMGRSRSQNEQRSNCRISGF